MSKREDIRDKRQRDQLRRRNALIILVSLVVIGIALGLILPNVIQDTSPIGDIVSITPNPRPQADGLNMGDPNAPVKVIEFSDFQCPVCKKFITENEPSIIKNYVETGKVYFTYSPFEVIGTESNDAAEAAYCAADQGKFWDYHDILFANQGAENSGQFVQRRLFAYADSIGLNADTFKSCFTSHKYVAQINTDQLLGTKYQVDGTPSFVINGKLFNWQSLSDVESAIAAAVGQK